MRRTARHSLLVGLAASVAALALSGTGCSSCSKTGSGGGGSGPASAAGGDLSLVPREANVVAAVNIKKLRPTPLWKRFTDLTDQTPDQKARYADFIKQTGLDPLKQVDAVFLALPATSAAGDFGAFVRGGPFDEDKLVAYIKAQAKAEGGDVVQSDYNGKKRYSDSRGGNTYGFFLDKSTIGFGNDAWSKKMIDLAAKAQGAESAQQNAELVALVKKTRTEDAVWGAGLVAAEARQRLAQNEQLKSAASMKDVYLSADLSGGFTFVSVVDLGSEADATDLANRLKEQLAQSRQNPQVQILGFGRYFDAIKVTSTGPALHLDVKLDQAGVDDLIERASGLLKSLGGPLGGGGGGMGPSPGGLAPMPGPGDPGQPPPGPQ